MAHVSALVERWNHGTFAIRTHAQRLLMALGAGGTWWLAGRVSLPAVLSLARVDTLK
jgi:hypothetical protein